MRIEGDPQGEFSSANLHTYVELICLYQNGAVNREYFSQIIDRSRL